METVKQLSRRFSLEKDFMEYNTDDLLFGAMQYLATYHPKLCKLYLTKKALIKRKKEIYNLCGLNAQSFNRHLVKLIEKGLVKEEEIMIGKDVYASYVFPYNYDENYQLVDNEMLWYVVSTRNNQAVRVYVYLLNCYYWKIREGDNYIFTNKDILKVLGYSTDNKLASSIISNILESFSREGVIKYAEFYEEYTLNNGNTIPLPRKKLLFVASKKSELK